MESFLDDVVSHRILRVVIESNDLLPELVDTPFELNDESSGNARGFVDFDAKPSVWIFDPLDVVYGPVSHRLRRPNTWNR
uniref:hypothetical protein n=1 Tax=Halopenitus malekzadehii TaxID=1267564 RepID=UPI001C4326F3|nr:hypothetical protein [Halopenitus malekzadehii]